ncbi:outer membrane protein assembly factor [Methylovirgula sp. 4M-Z18]|nr:outer membrane protein assembly factor [Methylovirgula sp. 4M-Z18]
MTLRILLSGSALFSGVGRADAFDFFGLWPSEKPPAINAQSLPYQVTFTCQDCSGTTNQALQDASNTYKLRQEPPLDGDSLIRRATQDLPRLLDAMWGAGYYNANVHVEIANVAVALDDKGSDRAAKVAETMRNAALVPVTFVVDPGPLFKLGDVKIYDSHTNAPVAPDLLPKRIDNLSRGAPASANEIRSAQAQIIDYMRGQSHPLAKVVTLRPVVNHTTQTMDIALVVDPGPHAGIGEVTVTGTKDLDPGVVKSFIYLTRGEDYSPTRLADTRKSIAQIKAVGSVKVRDGDALDKDGNLPIFVDVTERKQHAVGASAQYSTIDGPAVATYWEHRNLFGGGETLRFDLGGGYTVKSGEKWNDPNNLTGKFAVTFMKPALWGTRNDFVSSLTLAKEVTDYYDTHYGDVTAGIRHRFSDKFWVQAAGEYEQGQSHDILGKLDYKLVGVPVSANYDTTDNLLDPTRGVKVSVSTAPYLQALGSSINLLQSKAQASTYYAFDDEARYILAGRVAAGSLVGADIGQIPDDRRFFAGGAGSVRGYKYRSLSPEFADTPIGGRSLFESSVEARIKITDTIGIVPFFDAGGAFSSSYPDFKEPVYYAVGLGLRYYTSIGPIRLDVATPLKSAPGSKPVAVYIGIGQSF